jgi:hypothetical protein
LDIKGANMRKIFIIVLCTISFYGDMITIKEKNRIKIVNDTQYEYDNKLQIKFKKITPMIVNDFEKRYSLKLKQILVIGDYIYITDTNNILEIIKTIIKDDSNIYSIKPLWSKKRKKY